MHDRRHTLAPFRVGDAVHPRLQHRRVGQQRRLDLGGIDVLTTRDHQVVAPVEDIQKAFVVQAAQVAGAQPLARGRCADVARTDDRAADEDLAVLDLELDWEEGLAGRAQLSERILGRQRGDL